MEEILITELIQSLLKNETPSNVLLAGVAIYLLRVAIYLLRAVKQLKKSVGSIKDDVEFIKKNLHTHDANGKVNSVNVVPLSNNEKSSQ